MPLGKYILIGNCINSFDEDGDGRAFIPYSTVSEFACAEENYKPISKEEFNDKAVIPQDLKKNFKRENFSFYYDEDYDMHIMHDTINDIHHFFK